MFWSSRILRRAEIISGVQISNEIKRSIKKEVEVLERPPCLAVVLVGSRDDSIRYVKHKKIAAEACGIQFVSITLPDNISQKKLNDELITVGTNPLVDGVLLQLPLPPHLSARQALFTIHPLKDVDGLHPLNFGNLFLQDQSPLSSVLSKPENETTRRMQDLLLANTAGDFQRVGRRSHEKHYFIPCTALAVRTLLFSYLNRKYHFFSHNTHPEAEFKRNLHAVVVNKSMIVGVPTTALLLKEGHFNVTMCSRKDTLSALQGLMRGADVLVTAYGSPRVFDASFVKKGAVVIDVGINSVTVDGVSRVCGDVDIASVSEVAAAVTSVPGGVGPLTVAHLMQNVVKAYHLRRKNKRSLNRLYDSFLSASGIEASGAPQGSLDASREALDDFEEEEEDSDNSSFEV